LVTTPTVSGPPLLNPYAVLGVDPAATPDEVKTAYFALVRAHPPERDPEAFKRIRAAYEQLRDPEKRLETDMLRVQVWPEPSLKEIFDSAEIDPSRAQGVPIDPADVIRAARAMSDLGRHDFREDYREVNV
jgi:curved DNA-binding protein CbpA